MIYLSYRYNNILLFEKQSLKTMNEVVIALIPKRTEIKKIEILETNISPMSRIKNFNKNSIRKYFQT